MEFRAFAEAYRPELPENPWRGVPLVPRELAEMHTLLGNFGRHLHARLANGTPTPLTDTTMLSDLYVSRALELDTTIRHHHESVLATIDTASSNDSLSREQRTLAEFVDTTAGHRPSFSQAHPDEESLVNADQQLYSRILSGGVWTVQMFGHTQSQWFEILTGRPIHPEAWLRTQIGLANNASVTIEHRRRLYESQALYLPQVQPLRQAITGNLAEADALITLLNVVKREAGLTVVPAPPQFEAYAGAANADLLVLDLVREQIIGVQVKSFEAYKSRDRYDPDRVILIDASLDLFGTLSRRTRLGRSDSSTRSWPGQVTSHFLHGIRVPRPPWPWLDVAEFTTSRNRVLALALEARDRNREAEEIVRERVLTALGR